MKQQTWKYWISPILLVLLLLAGVWYYRPVTLDTLYPDLDPAGISVSVMRLSGDDFERAHFNLTDASSPEASELLDHLNALSIRRPPTNLLLQLLTPTSTGRQVQDGDYNYVIHIFGKDGGWVALQFFIDEWKYDTPSQSQYLPCRVANGAAVGQALGDYLWDLSQSIDSE